MSSITFFSHLISAIQFFCFAYFLGLNGIYLALGIISLYTLPRYIKRQSIHRLPQMQTGFEPMVSLVVTSFNEEPVIVPAIYALLQLDYPEFEIIIVNDGSTDNSLGVLTEEFKLEKFPAAFRQRIKHKPVRGVYQSTIYPNLRVIDKENGGCKADASNAGINGARYGLFMPLDADTILDRDCLKYLVQPFLLNPKTVAVGGTVRILNGCEVRDGVLTKIALPNNWLAAFQVLEYMRAFIAGRVGWTTIDALPLISGAFGLFNKEAVIEVGGYSTETLGEDMELVLRMHKHYRLRDIPYRVDFVADPIAWTEAPESFAVLRKQRVRWQRGLFDSLWLDRKLFFHPKSGLIGWLSLPFLLFLEGMSPIVEFAGYLFFIIGTIFGWFSLMGVISFLLLSLGTGILLTTISLVIEEKCFQTYPRTMDLVKLFLIGIIENIGYRQLMTLWRLEGTYKWIMRTEAKWGAMTRSAAWASTPAAPPPSVAPNSPQSLETSTKS